MEDRERSSTDSYIYLTPINSLHAVLKHNEKISSAKQHDTTELPDLNQIKSNSVYEKYLHPSQRQISTREEMQPETKLRNTKTKVIQDIYDENHYTLARVSGASFEHDINRNEDFEKTSILLSRILKKKTVIIICVLLVIGVTAGSLAYALIGQKGTNSLFRHSFNIKPKNI